MTTPPAEPIVSVLVLTSDWVEATHSRPCVACGEDFHPGDLIRQAHKTGYVCQCVTTDEPCRYASTRRR